MAEAIDNEIDAISAVLKALEPLHPEVRAHVIDYVTRRLAVRSPESDEMAGRSQNSAIPGLDRTKEQRETGPVHIKTLKEQKKPHSASEMAALVAYYLENLAPPNERKQTVNTKAIETYFKIAEFPLPTKTQFTLPNAKTAGYLDAVGNGEYKLNAVGHNLVVHSLPRDRNAKAASRKARANSRRARRQAKR